MQEQAAATCQHIAFGRLPPEVRSALLHFACEGEVVDIEEQTYRGHTLYEIEIEPTTQQSFRLLLGMNGEVLDKVFTGRHRQEPAPGCWG
jgi:hypothetical protein